MGINNNINIPNFIQVTSMNWTWDQYSLHMQVGFFSNSPLPLKKNGALTREMEPCNRTLALSV